MNTNPYLQKIKEQSQTTRYGVVGESLTAIGVFAPPPFNIALIGAGVLIKGIAWYFAQDRTPPKES